MASANFSTSYNTRNINQECQQTFKKWTLQNTRKLGFLNGLHEIDENGKPEIGADDIAAVVAAAAEGSAAAAVAVVENYIVVVVVAEENVGVAIAVGIVVRVAVGAEFGGRVVAAAEIAVGVEFGVEFAAEIAVVGDERVVVAAAVEGKIVAVGGRGILDWKDLRSC